MYSAACRYSRMVVAMPRLKSTGRLTSPARLSSAKFWLLRAPIWRISAYSATRSTSSGLTTSVTIFNTVAAPAWADDGPHLAAAQVRPEAQFLDLSDDLGDLVFRRVGLHHDDHGTLRVAVGQAGLPGSNQGAIW